MDGKVTIPPPPPTPPDSFVKAKVEAYEAMQKENKKIFLEYIFAPSKKYIEKFLSLPDYGDYILPFLTDQKPAELAYLYKLASMKDKNNELRIPGVCFPFFSEIPAERLKMIEPIITSKNYLGEWNYSANFITKLDQYPDKQLEFMAKLAKYKVNGFNLQRIASIPPFILDWDKVIEKAETLNKLYGKELREIELFVNENNEFYISAKISLPDKELNKENKENFKEVFAHIDLDLNPANKPQNEIFDSTVDTMTKNLETKLCLFKEEELDRIGLSILKQVPSATEEEIFIVMQKLTQFANYSCIQKISKELQKLNIGKIPAIGDINPYFDYFGSSKKLFPLSKSLDANYAFFITKKDINNKTEMKFIKEWLEKGAMKNIKFINLEGWSDGVNLLTDDKKLEEKTKQILLKAKKLTEKDKYLTFREAVSKVLNNHIETTMKNLGADITTISLDAPAAKSVIIDQMKPDYPSSDLLKSTIESISEHYTSNENLKKGLSERLAKYFATNLNVYSKQSIIENLKIIHKKIDDYLEANELPKENLYFITPKRNYKRKSFELITKMYAELYNVPAEKILSITDICQLNKFPPNSTFVAIDDIVGTGKSMTNIGEYLFYGNTVDEDKHILFAPISGTDFGISYIRGIIASIGRENNDKVIYIDTNIKECTSLKDVFKNLYYKIDNPSKYVYGQEGYDDSNQCTAFPYMTPDNNSIIANDITKYFVANYNCIKNPNTEMLKIEKETYHNNIFGSKNNIII